MKVYSTSEQQNTAELCRSISEQMPFVFREDEWFKVELPEYLFPRDGDVDASIVDMEAIREVCEVRSLRAQK